MADPKKIIKKTYDPNTGKLLSNVTTYPQDDWVDDGEWVDVPKDIKSWSISAKEILPELAKGVYEGTTSLIPSERVTGKAAELAYPPISFAIKELLRPLYQKGQEAMETVAPMLENRPKTVTGQVARGLGYLAPTLLPMSKGMRLVEALPTLLRRQGLKIPSLAGRGLLKTILRPAVGMGGYEGAKAALRDEPVMPAVERGATTGAIFGPSAKFGSSLVPKSAPFAKQIGSAVGGAVGGYLTSPEEEQIANAILMGGLGLMHPSKPIKNAEGRIRIAKRIVNSLIKPTEKELRIGDAGRGIAREGIWGWSLRSIRNEVAIQLKYLNDKLGNLYKANEASVADYKSVTEPLYKLQKEIQDSRSRYDKATFERVGDIIVDFSSTLYGKFQGGTDLTPAEARALKQEVVKFKRSEFEKKLNLDSGPTEIEKALNESYRMVDKILDKTVKGSEDLNRRVTDLIDAKEVIERRIRSIQGRPLLPRGSIFNPSTYEELLPPAVKTGLAAMIAPRPIEPKTLIPSKRMSSQATSPTAKGGEIAQKKLNKYSEGGGKTVIGAGIATTGTLAAGAANAMGNKPIKTEGEASTYGWGEKLNDKTASGEKFNPDEMTAAMYGVPFGTQVEVTDAKTGKKVVVKINDRGPNKRLNRLIDLSKGAWKALGYDKAGLTNVKIKILK